MEFPENHLSPVMPVQSWKLPVRTISTPAICNSDESGYGTTPDENDGSSKLYSNLTQESVEIAASNNSNSVLSLPDTSIEYWKTPISKWQCSAIEKTFFICRRSKLSMCIGEEFMDFIREFAQRNCDFIIGFILSYLSPQELRRSSWVSTTWRKVCLSDKKIKSKILKYIRECREIATGEKKENLVTSKKHLSIRDTQRIAFNNVQNIIPDNELIVQENKKDVWCKTRYELFREEAAKLHNGERLKVCPRCSSPSRVTLSENRGLCSRITCVYDFCIHCLNDFHGSLPCATKHKPVLKSEHFIGSKQSKRKLKRL